MVRNECVSGAEKSGLGERELMPEGEKGSKWVYCSMEVSREVSAGGPRLP